MQELTIRRAGRRDLADLVRLSDQLGYPQPARSIQLRFMRILRARRDHRIFVAVDKAGVVRGWIHAFVDKLLHTGPRMEIGGLSVDEACRGRGIGRALLERAEQWARVKGCSPIIVHTNVVREQAHDFYEKSGYRLVKQQKVYGKDL